MKSPNSLIFEVEQFLADPETGWSIGSFGAIGEFIQCEDDSLLGTPGSPLTVATTKGALRFNKDVLKSAQIVAYETLSANSKRWSHGLSLCLDRTKARRNCRQGLTNLGPDAGAILSTDRTALLFDLGLSQMHIDFCIRTSHPDLIAVLTKNIGRPVFAPDNPVMGAIFEYHPHRIVSSVLGRVEVFQKIGGPDTGGVSPVGPHTHLIPKLMKSGRTHSANIPIPTHLVPCCNIHPPNAFSDKHGVPIAFQKGRLDRFQPLLNAYGPAKFIKQKQRILTAFKNRSPLDSKEDQYDRLERTAIRVALRQIAAITQNTDDQSAIDWLKGWQSVYEPTGI